MLGHTTCIQGDFGYQEHGGLTQHGTSFSLVVRVLICCLYSSSRRLAYVTTQTTVNDHVSCVSLSFNQPLRIKHHPVHDIKAYVGVVI